MDKKSIAGFVLIAVILLVWMFVMNKNQDQTQQQKNEQTQKFQDSIAKLKKDSVKTETKTDTVKTVAQQKDSVKYTGMFGKREKGDTKTIIVETDKYRAEFSTKGGALIKFEVKGFKTWDNFPVQLVRLDRGGELNLLFTSTDGKLINTKDLYFSSAYTNWEKVFVKNEQYKLVYELLLDSLGTSKIIKTFTFRNDSYMFDMDVELVNANKFISNFDYQLTWENSIKLTEYRSDTEGGFAEAFASSGGELEVVEAGKIGENVKSDLNGNTDWVSSRTKYFCVALVSGNPKASGSYISGERIALPNEGFEELYSIALKQQVKNEKEKHSYKIYLGPVDYSILKSYDAGLEKTMRFTLDFLVRPIAQYAILPFFLFIHSFISNWGLVIIIFSVVMKIVLMPISRFQMKSMRKMSEMQPKMNAIKEKYKDEPQKQQQMLMKFYKEEKINPMSGCLPLLLQLPILYALFGVFNSTIELRQAYFGLWIHDLAIPDTIFNLPFKIPLFGINEISGLALLMGITMFIQQKMTVKDPKQKAMIYMMPIMMTLLFASLPAGLNLYYFVFNLISIAEQYYITHKKKPTEVVTNEKPQFKFKGKK